MTKRNFAIIGAAGYVAHKHFNAIRDTGNKLLAVLDPHDSVGILDQYSYDIKYFKEYEIFDRYLEKVKRLGSAQRVHFISICSPNYLHDAHIRTALRVGADAICEKPLVLNPWNLDALHQLELETNRKVFTILQLRVHPSIILLKNRIEKEKAKKKYEIELTYVTSRGDWYLRSWKGNVQYSGGIASNIGVHFFDMLIWIFGNVERSDVHYASSKKVRGYLVLERAHVKWFLSIDREDIPKNFQEKKQMTYRSITCDGEEIEFSSGFNDLHTSVYKNILNGKGDGIEEVRQSIELIHDIRESSMKYENN